MPLLCLPRLRLGRTGPSRNPSALPAAGWPGRALRAAAAALLLPLAGCGAAAAGAEASPAPAAPGAPSYGQPPTSIDASLEDLDRAERELDALLGGDRSKSADLPVTPGATGAAPLDGDGGCHAPCRALASMQRSADHLCGLAGDGDERCQGARGRVSRATDRVRAACPSCSASPP